MQKQKFLFFFILVLLLGQSKITYPSPILAAAGNFVFEGNRRAFFNGTVELPGNNMMAVQSHNVNLGSTDLSITPELLWIDNQLAINLIRHPYLQMLDQDKVVIVWTTTESGPSEVRYSTDLSYGNVVAATSSFKSVNAL